MVKTHYIISDLKEIRTANKATQQYVADKAGYDRVDINRWESGARSPKLNSLSNWAESLGYELVLRRKK